MRVPCASKTTSTRLVNCRSWSRIRYRTGSARSESVHATCRACCVTHSPSGRAVQPARPGTRDDWRFSIKKQRVQPLEPDGVDGEEIHGNDALSLRVRELTPRRTLALACWTKLLFAPDLLHSRR